MGVVEDEIQSTPAVSIDVGLESGDTNFPHNRRNVA